MAFNVSNPIKPYPKFSCLSLWAPLGFLESFKWITSNLSKPMILSNSSKTVSILG